MSNSRVNVLLYGSKRILANVWILNICACLLLSGPSLSSMTSYYEEQFKNWLWNSLNRHLLSLILESIGPVGEDQRSTVFLDNYWWKKAVFLDRVWRYWNLLQSKRKVDLWKLDNSIMCPKWYKWNFIPNLEVEVDWCSLLKSSSMVWFIF